MFSLMIEQYALEEHFRHEPNWLSSSPGMGKVSGRKEIKMEPKTQKEVEAEIKALQEIRPKVRPRSAFGTDNIQQLDAQIKVLEEDLENDEIYNEFDHSGIDEETLMAALDARQWIDGESGEENLHSGYPMK